MEDQNQKVLREIIEEIMQAEIESIMKMQDLISEDILEANRGDHLPRITI